MIEVNVLRSRQTRILVFILSTIVFLLHNVEPSVANKNGWVQLVRPDAERPFVQIPESWLEYLESHQDVCGKVPAPPTYSFPGEKTPYEIHPNSDNVLRAIAPNEMNDFVPVSETETETPTYPFTGEEIPYELPLNNDNVIPVIDPSEINQYDPALPTSMIEETTEAPYIVSSYPRSDEEESKSTGGLEDTPAEGNPNSGYKAGNAFAIDASHPIFLETSTGYVSNFPSKNEDILDSSEVEEIPTTTPATIPSDESLTFSPPFIVDDIALEPSVLSTPYLLPAESNPISGPVTEFQDPILYTEIFPAVTLDASQLPTHFIDNIETPESTDSWPPTELLPFPTPELSNPVFPTEILPSLPATQVYPYSESIITSPISLGEYSTPEFPYPSPPSGTASFFSSYASPTLPTGIDVPTPLPNLTPCQHNPILQISPKYNPTHYSSHPRKCFSPNPPNIYLPKPPPPYPYYPSYYSPYFTPPISRIPPPFTPRFNPIPQCYSHPRQYRT